MEIKYTIQGLLIYVATAAYLAAFVMTLVRLRKAGRHLYFSAFILACVALGYRGYMVRHVPMQNLFEVFLCMGALVYPISIFCRRVLRVSGISADMLTGAIVLFPAGFAFSDQPQHLPPALQSWLFEPHVAVYVLAYLFMAKAAYQGLCQLADKTPRQNMLDHEQATYRMIRVGFPLLTLGLILGSVWGKIAWGDYWGWDPKELWSLASWLVYVGYFHFRYMFGRKYARLNSIWAVLGMAVIIVTLLWVNLSQLFAGLHSYAT